MATYHLLCERMEAFLLHKVLTFMWNCTKVEMTNFHKLKDSLVLLYLVLIRKSNESRQNLLLALKSKDKNQMG